MLALIYAPIFVRQFHKLPKSLQGEVLEKIELFKDTKNHQSLKVHKLLGHLKGRYSFSVNYKYRIIFRYETKNQVDILAIGDHDVYQ
jgi:plasmid maintenance system killer protein